MKFKKGDRVIDINLNWPRCYQTGAVVSIKGNTISWQSDVDGEIITDLNKDMRRINSSDKGLKRKGMKVKKTIRREL